MAYFKLLLDDVLASIGTNGSGVGGSMVEGLGLASVRFRLASGSFCSFVSVFQFDVFAKLHIYLIDKYVFFILIFYWYLASP